MKMRRTKIEPVLPPVPNAIPPDVIQRAVIQPARCDMPAVSILAPHDKPELPVRNGCVVALAGKAQVLRPLSVAVDKMLEPKRAWVADSMIVPVTNCYCCTAAGLEVGAASPVAPVACGCLARNRRDRGYRLSK